MKSIIYFTMSMLIHLGANAQVLFSKDKRVNTSLQLTFMGRPFVEADSSSEIKLKMDSTRIYVHQDSIAFRERLNLERSTAIIDSLQLIQTKLDRLSLDEKSINIRSLISDIPSILPLRITNGNIRFSSKYGFRLHPITGLVSNHTGVDLPAPVGTPVYATADGYIDRIILQPDGIGLAIYISHPTGYRSVYGHLSAYVVEVKDIIRRGDLIGYVGTTGNVTGPHLHYSLLYNGTVVNPEPYCFLLADLIKQKRLIYTKTGKGND